jgi:OmpA-OmpF porin, OOP family
MRLTALLGATALIAVSAGAAQAGNFNGWYIGLEGGANWLNDNDGVFLETGVPVTPATFDFDTGWALLGTLGYSFGSWRVEGELGYRQNDIDAVAIGPFFTPLPGDDVEQFTIMANALYDIRLSDRFNISLGGGLGVDRVDLDDGLDVSDDHWGFAYQGIVGLSYAVSRRMDVTMNYRYLNADGSDFDSSAFPIGYSSENFQNHTVTIGLRYDLSPDEIPAPPAPPPPPPPVEPRQFIVFFGFDKYNLTEEAQRVVAEAADAAKNHGSASIVVIGHTDTVGSAAYNQALSERRANTVREALVALGIDGGAISASGRGKTELLVQTGDNVKEPQNRRATIDLDGPST